MAELTREQQQAVSLARARRRRAEAEQSVRQADPQSEAPKYGSFGQEAIGLGETALQLGTGAIAAPLAGLAGLAGTALPGQPGQGARFVEGVQEALTYQPRTQVGQRTSEAVAKPFEAFERFADTAGEVSGAPDDVLGATAVKTAIMGAPAALGLRGRRAPTRPAPSLDELRTQSRAAYAKAEQAGLRVSEPAVRGASSRIQQVADTQGLDPTLHPASTAAAKRLREIADRGELTLTEMETMRRIFQNAEQAASRANPADARMAGLMRRRWDDFLENLGSKDVVAGDAQLAGQALREARTSWSRMRKGELIDDLMERAELSRNTPAGYEAALRNEFKRLAKNKREMQRFTPEEQAAIREVVIGGSIEGSLRLLGRMAPRTVMGTALTAGAGGFMAGPVGAVGLPLVGEAARQAGSTITRGKVGRTSELMRRGSPTPAGPDPALVRSQRIGAATEAGTELTPEEFERRRYRGR